MSKKDFEEFINSEPSIPKKTIDWEEKKKWWLDKLDTFYSEIESWLKDYTVDGRMECSRENVDLYEDFIGKYSAKKMIIKFGRHRVVLLPIGTLLIGAKGRVDMCNIESSNIIRFVLVPSDSKGRRFVIEEGDNINKKKNKLSDEPIDWVWKKTTSPPKIVHTNLDEETFLGCLKEILNG